MDLKIQYSVATESNAQEIFNLINDAYKIEDGNTGVGFKNTNRLLNPFDSGLDAAYFENRVIVARTEEGRLLGTIVWELSSSDQSL